MMYTKKEEQEILIPLLKKFHQWHQPEKTIIIGIQGGQGTGKTTLVNVLQEVLSKAGYTVTSFSIDDFYTSWKERELLAKKYSKNPFYQISRGLPGTHQVKLLKKVLEKLRQGKQIEIPLFDKSLHQGAGDSIGFRKITQKQDFVLFEGWCLGLPVISFEELQRICKKEKINLKKLDPSLKHAKIVLQFVNEYQPLWKYIDHFIMLQPNSSSLHLQWRLQQEKELKQKKGSGMSKREVEKFVEPFLPFTYACYEKVNPDVKILIDKKHRMYGLKDGGI
ncbi:hypothetical protein HYX13_03655 [Candidatus Woesearchaeota archaeon]|nr:hypothetical protein [Candidatus Woesearchaeota archaeon]